MDTCRAKHPTQDKGRLDMMWSVFTWSLTIAAIIGVILNIKKMRVCFYIWAVTNFGWMVVDFHKEIYAQSALFLIYFLLALYGIWEWREKKGEKE